MMFTSAESVLASRVRSDWASRPDADLAAVTVDFGTRALAVKPPGSEAPTEAGGVTTDAARIAAESATDVFQSLAGPAPWATLARLVPLVGLPVAVIAVLLKRKTPAYPWRRDKTYPRSIQNDEALITLP